jgi:hypothetical protein
MLKEINGNKNSNTEIKFVVGNVVPENVFQNTSRN